MFNLRPTFARSDTGVTRIRTLLAAALTLALVIEPVGVTLHAMRHIVSSGTIEFVAHDESSHATHVEIDHHHLCGLCVHSKCTDAILASVPSGTCRDHDSGFAYVAAEHAPSARDAAAAPSRAPPSLA